MGPNASERLSQRRECIRRRGPLSEWMGVDFEPLWALCRIPPVPLLPRLFRGLFRWLPLCDEGRISANRAEHAAEIFSQLVPTPLPIRLRGVPVLRCVISFQGLPTC